MGAKAREKALAEFDEQVVFARIQETYTRLLQSYVEAEAAAS